MSRTRIVDGVEIPLTAQEETDRDAEELAVTNAKPMEDWKESIRGTDSNMPRFLEDLISSNESLVIPTEMKKRYDAKIKIRAEKP